MADPDFKAERTLFLNSICSESKGESPPLSPRVSKYAKFGVFYAKIVQMTPQRLRRESVQLQKFSVTNREPLRLQKFSVTSTVLSLPFSQQI